MNGQPQLPESRYEVKFPVDLRGISFLIMVLVLVFFAVAFFVQRYFSDEGVRWFGIIIGILLLVGGLFAMFMLSGKFFFGYSKDITNSVVNALIISQAADDSGEIARAKSLEAIQRAYHDAENARHDQEMHTQATMRQARLMAKSMGNPNSMDALLASLAPGYGEEDAEIDIEGEI